MDIFRPVIKEEEDVCCYRDLRERGKEGSGGEDGETDEGEDRWELPGTNGLPLLYSEHTWQR